MLGTTCRRSASIPCAAAAERSKETRNSSTGARPRASQIASTCHSSHPTRTNLTLTSELTRCQYPACGSCSWRHPPVERPILDGLGEMDGLQGAAAGQVGDRPRDLQDAVEGAGGEAELLEGGVEE